MYILNKNDDKKITIKSLMRFLEENEVNYLEDDLSQILYEFKVERMLYISADQMYQYFTKEIWKLSLSK